MHVQNMDVWLHMSADASHPGDEPPDIHEADEEIELHHEPTPIFISPRTRNILIAAIVIGIIFLVRAAPTILTISLGGVFLALILSFPVRLLSMIMPRALAILLTLLGLLGSIVLAVFILVPILISQLTSLIDSIPDLVAEGESWLREAIRPFQDQGMVSEDTDSVLDDIQEGLIERASVIAERLLDDILGAVTQVFDLGIKAFGILFVAIYLLIDIRRIKATFVRLAPARYRRDALELWEGFGLSLSRYLGGLSISLMAQGILSTIALWAIGVPYPLLLGLWVSMTAIIPYLGAFLGAIPAVLLAFYVSPTTGILAIVLYIFIQQVESNLLTPRIQGQAVRVHPIIVLLTVIAATEIDGLRGAIFAVPMLAVVRVLLDFLSVRLRVQP
jgi:predicted PurR-regulated permease PerM